MTTEAAAVKSIDELAPDVVILEWANRTERRVEQAARLRAHALAMGHRLRIVIVTQEYETPSAAVLSAVDAYFTKPVALESLEEAIVRIVEGRGS